MTPPEYIRALIEGHNPLDAPPADYPWSEISQRLMETPIADRALQFQQWLAQANGQGESVMAALVDLQSEALNPQSQRMGRLWSLNDLILENFGDLPVMLKILIVILQLNMTTQLKNSLKSTVNS